jgi:hypothetical protein
MGTVFAEITLKNGRGLVLAQSGHITEQNIRSITVNALVDTGTITLVINEDIRQKLGLAIEGARIAPFLTAQKLPVKVQNLCVFIGKTVTPLAVLGFYREGDDVLLGAISLEEKWTLLSILPAVT